MNDNEKIHKILEYICDNYSHGIVDTDEIAEAINLSLSETNKLARQIIKNGDAKEGGSDKTTNQKGAISILQTVATNDAYQTKKYLKKSKSDKNESIPLIWKWIFAIVGAMAAIATIYQVFFA